MWDDGGCSNTKMTIDYKVLPIGTIINNIKSFKGFAELFKFKEKTNLESSIFYLHSVVTVFIMFIGTMFLTMNQYFGQPIKCLTNNDKNMDLALMQHYCWMEGVFSLPNPSIMNNPYQHQQHQLYPGVKPYQAPNPFEKPVYHRYYQWVYFILIIQSVLFYFPRHLWKKTKSQKIRALIKDANVHILAHTDEDRLYVLQETSDLIHTGKTYFTYYLSCEVFYLVHLLAEIWFTNIFLGGSFIRLGYDWLFISNDHYDPNLDPLVHTFPRLAKCTFHTYGITGTLEAKDMLCFLPMNIVNEKLYIVLWFWFFFLLFITFTIVMTRIFWILPYFRYLYLRYIAPTTTKRNLTKLSKTFGGFFIMQLIAKNIRPNHFAALCDELVLFLYDEKSKIECSKKYKEIMISSNASNNLQPTAPLLSSSSKSKKHKSNGKTKAPAIGFNITAEENTSKTETKEQDPYDWDNGQNNGDSTNNDNWNESNANNDNWDSKIDDDWNGS